MLELDRGGDVHRAQRRNHVRVDVSLLLHARVEQHSGEREQDVPNSPRITGERIKAVTRNISGGGISFRTPASLADGDRIVVTFYLPEHGGDITSRAKVVHAHPDPERPGPVRRRLHVRAHGDHRPRAHHPVPVLPAA